MMRMKLLLMLFLLAANLQAQSVARPVVNPISNTDIYPIAVWAMPSNTAPAFAEMGVNIFVAGGRGVGWCDTLVQSGVAGYMHWSSSRSQEDAEAIASSPGFLGWMHGDEPDNPEVIDDVFRITRRPPEDLQAAYDEMMASTTPAPMYLNLGQGLANGLAQSTPDSVYPAFCKSADIVCYDVYPTSTQERGVDRLHLTARGVERLRAFAGPDKPLWIWLECTDINGGKRRAGNRAPYAHELRAEVWMSIVHGADGIGYFPHQFNPYRGGPAAIPEAIQTEMATTNHLLHSLAPVLRTGNKQRLPADARPGQISAALWERDGESLLVVVNMRSEPSKGRIELPQPMPELRRLDGGRIGSGRVLGGRPDAGGDKGQPAGWAVAVDGEADARSLSVDLQPYEVVILVGGMDAVGRDPAIGSYADPEPPSVAVERPETPARQLVTSLDQLTLQPAREIQWSRSQDTRLAVPSLTEAPDLDGQLDDDIWTRAAPLASWTNIAGEGAPAMATRGWAGVHDGSLYMAFRAAEPSLDSLVTRYAAYWRNDCIELWFDPDNRRTSFAHLILTSDARVQSERMIQDHWGEGWRDEDWSPRITIESGRESGAWTLEMSVPLVDLGIDADAAREGAIIAFDAARERKTSGGENSVWTRGGFRAAVDFGELSFGPTALVLADGVLYNHSPSEQDVRVEILVSERRELPPGAEWEELWVDLAIEDRVVRVPGSTGAGPGARPLIDAEFEARVPDGGRLRFVVKQPAGDLLEEFVAFVELEDVEP